MVKRFFDIVFSILGLPLLAPFFLIIGLLIKLGSRGPVFYRGIRVGKNGKPFRIWKFRTMIENPLMDGPQISIDGDPRVTTLGRILRRLKINELPQFDQCPERRDEFRRSQA